MLFAYDLALVDEPCTRSALINNRTSRYRALRRRERQVEPCNGSARHLRNLLLTDALRHLFPSLASQVGVESRDEGRNPLARVLKRGKSHAELIAGGRADTVAEQSGQEFLGPRVAHGERWAAPVVEALQAGTDSRPGPVPGLGHQRRPISTGTHPPCRTTSHGSSSPRRPLSKTVTRRTISGGRCARSRTAGTLSARRAEGSEQVAAQGGAEHHRVGLEPCQVLLLRPLPL